VAGVTISRARAERSTSDSGGEISKPTDAGIVRIPGRDRLYLVGAPYDTIPVY
jgi:hypothetical protein